MNWNIFRRKAAAKGSDMGVLRIVSPQARDRWLTASARQYTPERIEQVLRSAFSGSLVASWELFDLMEGTWPRLQKNLNELKRAVISLEWNLQAWATKGEKPTPEAQRRADFVEDVIWTMRPNPDADENGFEDTVRDLLDAWGKGVSVLELEWEQRTSAQWRPRGGWAVRATRWIHPRYYGYPPNETRLMLNAQETGVALPPDSETKEGWAAFPDNKFLISVAKQKSGPVIGAALLRPLAFWWCASNFGAEWLLNYAQLFGVPLRWANYDANKPGLLDQISEMLENLGSAGWAAFPAGTTLELKEASKSGQDNPQAYLLTLADKICDILILGQTLTTDAGDKGTQALGTVHQSVRGDVIQAAGDFVARILNEQLIPALLWVNFGDEADAPWFMPALKESDAKAKAERDTKLLPLLPMPKEWLYNRHDIPMPEPDEETIGGQLSQPAEDDEGPSTKARAIHAKATDTLLDNVMESVTGVQARWLGGIRPVFVNLLHAAKNQSLSDADFVTALEKVQRDFPELLARLNAKELETAFYNSMSAAAVNGAVEGYMRRRTRRAR